MTMLADVYIVPKFAFFPRRWRGWKNLLAWLKPIVWVVRVEREDGVVFTEGFFGTRRQAREWMDLQWERRERWTLPWE